MLASISALVGGLFSVIDKVVENETERQKIKAKINEMVLSNQLKELEAASEIIKAEANGHSWLQRNWRPLLMMNIIVIIFNNYILVPYLNAFFGLGIILELPDQLWTLMITGVGGYVGGRTVEKVSKNVTVNLGKTKDKSRDQYNE